MRSIFKFKSLLPVLFFILASTGCLTNRVYVKDADDLKINDFHEAYGVADKARWLNQRWNYVMSFYQQHEEPYFGRPSVSPSCRELSIRDQQEVNTPLYQAKLVLMRTNEFGLPGICNKDEQTHFMRVAFIVCNNKNRQADIKRICPNESCEINSGILEELCLK